jgi:DNA topoisomerase-1
LPGQELFQYEDENGGRSSVDSADVNDYLRRIMGEEFTAKDFRTWGGSVVALDALLATGPAESAAEAKSKIVEAVKLAAERLANTPAVCRSCYIHPAIIESYQAGSLPQLVGEPPADRPGEIGRLSTGELRLLSLLRRMVAGGSATRW